MIRLLATEWKAWGHELIGTTLFVAALHAGRRRIPRPRRRHHAGPPTPNDWHDACL